MLVARGAAVRPVPDGGALRRQEHARGPEQRARARPRRAGKPTPLTQHPSEGPEACARRRVGGDRARMRRCRAGVRLRGAVARAADGDGDAAPLLVAAARWDAIRDE
eukprot:1050033-Prymnesium_polylepis.1